MSVLQPHPMGVPTPHPTRYSQPFWDGCRVGELRYQRCASCGTAIFDPASVCRSCSSSELAWEVSAGRGRVYSWSVVWRPPSAEFTTPYAVAIVDLDEGFQMLANLVGCEPSEIAVGQSVSVEFHPISEDYSLPYFSPGAEVGS